MEGFKKLLIKAKMGDKAALQTLQEMYNGLIVNESRVYGVFDADLRQCLYKTLLDCINGFEI